MDTLITLLVPSIVMGVFFVLAIYKVAEARRRPTYSARMEKEVAEAHRIEDEFRQGRLLWDRSEFNCADVVVRILRAGGYDRSPPLGRRWLPVMPLDIFEEARQACEEDASLRMELVAYRQVPGAQAAYRFSRFPLSLGQPLRSVARALREAPRRFLPDSAPRSLPGLVHRGLSRDALATLHHTCLLYTTDAADE
jgi:hypothetical protein